MNKRFQMLFMFYPRFGSKVGKKCHFGQTINAWRSVWCHCPLLHWVGQIKKPLFCQQALKTQLQRVRLHESSASGHLKLKKKKRKMVKLRWKIISGMIHIAVLFYLFLV